MISIIIPVYNQAQKLSQCLDSIKNQTYNNYEIIIVNDGSTDNINKVINNFKKSLRVTRYALRVINQNNQGSNSARNRGAEKAQGEFLLFCDADIVMKSDMLKIMLGTLQNNPQASYAYSSFKYGAKTFKLWPFDANKLKQMPYIHTTSLMRKEHFPGFDEKIKRLQDWDLWLTMLEQGHIGVLVEQNNVMNYNEHYDTTKYHSKISTTNPPVLFKVQAGGTMSSWLPSVSYKLFPFLPSVKKYNEAVRIIKEKHGLK